jgi:hypothetical protein
MTMNMNVNIAGLMRVLVLQLVAWCHGLAWIRDRECINVCMRL